MQTCAHDWCGATFEITDDDLAFYDKVSPEFGGKRYLIPPPTLCPECRSQRRAAWRNERSYYSRKCGHCDKSIVTTYADDVSFPVYCYNCWWSDTWDGRDEGQDFDFSRPFFEQYFAMSNRVPHLALMNDNGIRSENCEYTYDFAYGKDCYLVAGAGFLEHCLFCGGNCLHGKHLVDCYDLFECELCYECLDSRRLYNCRSVRNSENCTDCMFGFDLKGCKNCFGCFGLRQKEYHWCNQALSKEEYRRNMESFQKGSFVANKDMQEYLEAAIVDFPRRDMQMHNCEDCTGDFLFNCKETKDSYMSTKAEYSRFVDKGENQVHCYDILHTTSPQYCYENLTPDHSYMTHFSQWCWITTYNLYCDNCHHAEHLFGCTSLKNAKHCILNKQYSKEEFAVLVPRIIDHMRQTGEWGEMMPASASPYGYNESMANDYFPLNKEEVITHGWKWRKRNDERNTKGIRGDALPDSIEELAEDITQQVILCAETARPFRFTKQEIDFYRAHDIPPPRFHPDERHRRRFQSHNPQKLWKRNCEKCQRGIQTTYAPDRPEIVYCEECYLKEVY